MFEPDHPIRAGVISRAPLTDVAQVEAFPDELAPVQIDDRGTTISAVPRGALRVRAAGVALVVCHLKSKLLSFPGGRFSPHDEGERARYGAYALHRRAAEAVTVRAAATSCSPARAPSRGLVSRRPQRRAARRHHADPARPAGLGDRHRGLRPARPRRRLEAVEPRAADPGRAALLARVRGPPRADRPRARQPLPRHARERRRHRRRRAGVDRPRAGRAPRLAGLRPRAGLRALRPLSVSPRAASPRRACPPRRRSPRACRRAARPARACPPARSPRRAHRGRSRGRRRRRSAAARRPSSRARIATRDAPACLTRVGQRLLDDAVERGLDLGRAAAALERDARRRPRARVALAVRAASSSIAGPGRARRAPPGAARGSACAGPRSRRRSCSTRLLDRRAHPVGVLAAAGAETSIAQAAEALQRLVVQLARPAARARPRRRRRESRSRCASTDCARWRRPSRRWPRRPAAAARPRRRTPGRPPTSKARACRASARGTRAGRAALGIERRARRARRRRAASRLARGRAASPRQPPAGPRRRSPADHEARLVARAGSPCRSRPTSARPRLTISSRTRSRSVSPPIARAIAVVASRRRTARSSSVAALLGAPGRAARSRSRSPPSRRGRRPPPRRRR